MSLFDEYCDIIEGLARRDMYHAIEEILCHLDYESLQLAELASPVWLKASCKMKMWPKLLNKNISSRPLWKKGLAALQSKKKVLPLTNESSYKQLCCSIGDSLKVLEENWDSFNFTSLPKIMCKSGPAALYTDVGGQWIGYSEEDEDEMDDNYLRDRIILRFRWLPENETILIFPLRGMDLYVSNVRVNDKYIVASLHNRPEIFVWDSSTTKLLFVLNVATNRRIDEDYWFLHHLCLWEDYLFSCESAFGKPSAATLWKMPSGTGEEATMIYRIAIPSSTNTELGGAEMDDSFLVLFKSGECHDIEVRKMISFEIVATIATEEHACFHYLSGLIATGKHENKLKIWNAATGACSGSIRYEESLLDLRMLSDKFLISCNNFGELQIWDLQVALHRSIEPTSGLLLKRISVVSDEDRLVIATGSLMVDEFQIVLFAELTSSDTNLYVLDFSLDGAK